MNVLLPLFLLLIGNLALYWVFFGKKQFERKVADQYAAAELRTSAAQVKSETLVKLNDTSDSKN